MRRTLAMSGDRTAGMTRVPQAPFLAIDGLYQSHVLLWSFCLFSA
jgi:hypothetical protein